MRGLAVHVQVQRSPTLQGAPPPCVPTAPTRRPTRRRDRFAWFGCLRSQTMRGARRRGSTDRIPDGSVHHGARHDQRLPECADWRTVRRLVLHPSRTRFEVQKPASGSPGVHSYARFPRRRCFAAASCQRSDHRVPGPAPLALILDHAASRLAHRVGHAGTGRTPPSGCRARRLLRRSPR